MDERHQKQRMGERKLLDVLSGIGLIPELLGTFAMMVYGLNRRMRELYQQYEPIHLSVQSELFMQKRQSQREGPHVVIPWGSIRQLFKSG